MVKQTKRKKSKPEKKQRSPLAFFALFIIIALATVVMLEYIDHHKGKKTFIFDKLVPLNRTARQVELFNNEFQRILEKNRIKCVSFKNKENPNKYHFQIEVDAPRYDGLIAQLKRVAGKAEGSVKLAQVEGMPDKTINLFHVLMGDQITHAVLITRQGGDGKKITPKLPDAPDAQPKPDPQHEPAPPESTQTAAASEQPVPVVPSDGSAPRIAFIIDDIGAYELGALELKRLNIPITASILPDSPYAHEQARWVREYGLQSMLHIPMQPQNGGATYDHLKTITLNSTDAEIRNLIQRSKKIIPHAGGLNNHQGSLATSNVALMRRTMKIIKEENLFFVDSRTIGSSIAFQAAQKQGVPATQKDVFLDHVNTYPHSKAQIRRLVEIALKKGHAVAIGHPHATTINAIRDSIPYIRSKGVKIVFVSELLQ